MTSLRGWVSSRRSLTVRSAPVVWLVLAALGSGLGCDGDAPSGPGKAVDIGTGDRTENGRVAVEEAKLRGSIDRGSLTLQIPVRSVIGETGRGRLQVKLLSVDGKQELDTQEVAYELEGEESATLTATLAVPKGVKAQADLVGYSIRIEDGAEDGLRVTRSLLYVVPLLDLRVEGPSNLRPEREGYYRVSVRDALDNAPVEDQSVTFEVLRGDDVVQTHEVKTEVTGDASLKLALEEPGEFTVRARMAPGSTPTEVMIADAVTVERGAGKLLLTTDKPIYQPGQLVHLRALSLGRDGNRPIAGRDTTFEIEDAKGNKIFKKVVRTSDFGVAATTFRLGNILNEGTFKLRALSKDSESEKTISVSRYALPKFDVSLRTEEPWYAPGAEIVGAIDTRYFFGKPVQGGVTIEAYSLDVGTTLFQKTMGTLDAQGHYDFSLTLPAQLPGLPLEQGNAAVELRVTVTDSAGQKVVKSSLVTVSASGATVVVVPESGALVPGVENQLLLFATDPLGAPLADADVSISPPSGGDLTAKTDAYGQASLTFTPGASGATSGAFGATVRLQGGKTVRSSFDFSTQSGAEHLLLRTDKSVYQVGDEVRVDVTSTESKGTVYVDWINDGQTVDMRTLTAEDGQVSFTTTLDTSLTGSNRIEAYLVDSEGQIVRTGRTIFARTDAALNVEVSADRDVYAPGTKAKLTLSVTDEKGEPAVAALGLQIVDQAVFALVDAKPGLLRTYFEIEDRLAQPQYELHAPAADFSSLLFQETAQKSAPARRAAQRKTAAALAAMKNTSLTGIQRASLGEVLTAAKGKLEPVYSAQRTELSPKVNAAAKEAAATLEKRGCVLYGSCGASGFFDELQRELASSLTIHDLWGNPMSLRVSYEGLSLTSSGPDERAATADDAVTSFPLFELMLSSDDGSPSPGNGAGFPSGAGGTGGAEPPLSGDGAQAPAGEEGPRVRRDFPETLYVNPSVITDERGQATLDVDMADSITEWRVSALASSADGRLGGSESGIRVFQDFFVDVSFPAALTRGDEVSFPIAVYNYLDGPQTVTLKLEPAPWYTALGVTQTSVKLEAGQVLGVSFPVKVNDVGLQSLTVVAQGDQKSDAVARTVRVVPDGKAFPLAFSGTIDQGSAAHTVTFPASEVPGSQQLYLDVFPAFLSQAVQGMDSILAEPNGCFEQTTSSAWPNVLVTRYMKDTKQITPEIELKAEALMSTGYQRLLTFEHRGGGFSWFGEQDPAPFLSVTAFGIMEFSDMAQVHDVDQAMIERTVAWMLSQQNPDGSFEGDMSEFFSFYTSTVRNTAFTAWALATAGETGGGVQSALDFVKRNLGPDNDPYTLALVANAFALAAPSDPLLTDVLGRLDDAKITDEQGVHWDSGGTQTNFYGGGNDAVVATTALVAHALLLTGSGAKDVEDALKFLTSKKDPAGNFGSTQATIWTLRTLLLSAKKGTSGAVGSLSVNVDGNPVQTVSLTKAQSDVMSRIDLTTLATPGEHQVSLAFSGTGRPTYNLVQSYHLPWAAAPQEGKGPLSIDVSYDKSELFVNDSVRATVTLKNNEDVTQNMVLLTLGIAPGFEVDTDDLQPYLASGAVSRFETTGRQLILYLTKVVPGATQVFEYDLLASMPVTAVDGGAEAKLYYEPQKRTKAAAKQLTVAAR